MTRLDSRATSLIIGFAICAAQACGGSSGGPAAPSPSTNRVPTVSAISVTPAFGISQVTRFSLLASGSDPDGDPLNYLWSFPGGTASGPSASATITGAGSTLVSLNVTDPRGGSAAASRSITLGSMTGRWRGENRCGDFEFTFTQNGTRVTGSGRALQRWCNVANGSEFRTDPAEPGRIDANGRVEIRYKVGVFIDAYMRGQMDSTGRRVTGGMFNSGFNGDPFTLIKQ